MLLKWNMNLFYSFLIHPMKVPLFQPITNKPTWYKFIGALRDLTVNLKVFKDGAYKETCA